MKLTLLICLVAVAAAAPEKDAKTVVDERSDSGDGNFHYNFETSNGIAAEKTGTPGSEGQSNYQGSFRFKLPDGTNAEVRYIADELGYRPESPLIPTPHPLPAHAVEQIRVAEEQRARGITFD
ncbi:cuticle protein AM1159-like [Procambarus clarkii]|uniref:cuticle protein AM1159-like n=1 Tax=Procambarus clarkii TaxID=6728 RepID=UPI001E672282|nr:cuticle protein AM1159-like [Procambarus clarkii]